MSWKTFFSRPRLSSRQPSLRVDELVQKLEAYLSSIVIRDPDTEVRPAIAAHAIQEGELDTLAAFYVLEEQHVVHSRYGLYCSNSQTPIFVFDSLSEVEQEGYCDICDETHCTKDRSAKVELYFTIDIRSLEQRSIKAA